MKKFKKILLSLIFVLSVFVFVGCGNKEYTITYDLDGGTCENLVTNYVSGEPFELPLPSKEGYTFLGWYQSEELVNNLDEGNYILEAKWVADEEMFEEKIFTYDGTEQKMVLEGPLPKCYQVIYKNNANTEVGKYYVKATLKDSAGNIVKTFKSRMIIDVPKNLEFEKAMDDLLVEMFQGDQMSVNFFFKDYELFGIEHSDAELPRADMSSFEDDMAESIAYVEELKAYDVNTLSMEQKDCLEFVLYLFENSNLYTENMSYMTNDYLGSYLGYQANLPLELAEYKFYTEQDVIDFLGYLEDAPEAFKSYYEFACLQAEKGYGMTDTVIDNVVSQCEKFVAIKEDNYLVGIFNDKVDKCDFLTDDQKNDYKSQAEGLIKGSLTDAYAYIQENLPKLKGKAKVNGGLACYGDEGKRLYEIMLSGELGVKDLKGDEAIAYIEAKLEYYDKLMNQVITSAQKAGMAVYNTFVNVVNGSYNYSKYEYTELLDYYKEASKKFVPDLPIQPEITINYVPKSLEENFSPACYFVSPLDVKNKESIYLNGAYTDDYNYVFITMAHEGYPGHLYQYSYAKELDIHNIRKVLRNSGYTEGWATYMEINAYDFVKDFTSKGHQFGLKYLKYSDIFWGLMNCRIDLGIHYEAWDLTSLTKYMNDFFGYTLDNGYGSDDLVDAYNQMVEIPTNVAKYFYAHALLLDMHTKAEEALGKDFNEVLFNKCLLDYGALPLEMLDKKVDEFIADQLAMKALDAE